MRKILTLCCLLLSLGICAQNKTGVISGAIQDAEGKPLSSITVSLIKAQDSSLVKMAVTAKDGKFEFEKIADGQYRVSITSVGYDKKVSELFQISQTETTVQLKAFEL